jgi:hypothetical protein
MKAEHFIIVGCILATAGMGLYSWKQQEKRNQQETLVSDDKHFMEWVEAETRKGIVVPQKGGAVENALVLSRAAKEEAQKRESKRKQKSESGSETSLLGALGVVKTPNQIAAAVFEISEFEAFVLSLLTTQEEMTTAFFLGGASSLRTKGYSKLIFGVLVLLALGVVIRFSVGKRTYGQKDMGIDMNKGTDKITDKITDIDNEMSKERLGDAYMRKYAPK